MPYESETHYTTLRTTPPFAKEIRREIATIIAKATDIHCTAPEGHADITIHGSLEDLRDGNPFTGKLPGILEQQGSGLADLIAKDAEKSKINQSARTT